MWHWQARRLLLALPDGSLPRRTETRVRAHAAGCSRCGRVLREQEACEILLARIPSSIVPLEWSPASYGRLVSLGRWSPEPWLPDPERWRAPILGLVSAVAVICFALSVGHWGPVLSESSNLVKLTDYPSNSTYLPGALRLGRF